MNEYIDRAIQAIEAQQKKVMQRGPQWMVGEPQKDYLCLNCLKECGWEPVYPTNADRIRSMSDEELASFMQEPFCEKRTLDECQISYCGICSQCILDWLHAPACAKEGE